MSVSDIVGWVLTLIIALGGWIFAWLQVRSNKSEKRAAEQRAQLQKKLDRVYSHLNTYGELISLYRLYASGGDRLKKNEQGEFIRDSEGEFVVEKYMHDPEPRFEAALQAMRKSDIQGVIAQLVLTLRLNDGEVSDLLHEFDSSGNLGRQHSLLYYETVDAIEKTINGDDIMVLVRALNEATEHRRKIRKELAQIESAMYEPGAR